MLYQWAELAVSRSTSARPVQLRRRSWLMSSVLYRPMIDSMRASPVRGQSPTVPIDGAMPAWWRASVKLMAVYWLFGSQRGLRPLAQLRTSDTASPDSRRSCLEEQGSVTATALGLTTRSR